jgi:hypothetical protein
MQKLNIAGLEWIQTCNREEVDSRRPQVLAGVRPPSKTASSAGKIPIVAGSAYVLIRGISVIHSEIRNGDFLTLAFSLALGVAGISLLIYLNGRNVGYSRRRLEKNLGREFLIDGKSLFISLGELTRSPIDSDLFLKNGVLKHCRLSRADYLAVNFEDASGFSFEKNVLEIFPKTANNGTFELNIADSELEDSAEAFKKSLNEKLPIRGRDDGGLRRDEPAIKKYYTREDKIGIAFVLFLIGTLAYQFFRSK